MENERFETLLKWSLNPECQVSLEKVRSMLKRTGETEFGQSKKDGENGGRRELGPGRKGEHNFTWSVPKVATLVLALLAIGTGTVYAGSRIFNKVTVLEHEISVGEPLKLSWEDLDSGERDVGQIISHEEGGPKDLWMEKEVVAYESSLNTTYNYVSYDRAMGDVIFANLFSEPMESSGNARYNITEFEGGTRYGLNATFRYQKGSVYLHESLKIGKAEGDSRSEDAFQSSIITAEPLKNTRTYTSEAGTEFTLADLSYGTYAIVSVDQHVISLSFRNLTEEEIHQVLDMVVF